MTDVKRDKGRKRTFVVLAVAIAFFPYGALATGWWTEFLMWRHGAMRLTAEGAAMLLAGPPLTLLAGAAIGILTTRAFIFAARKNQKGEAGRLPGAILSIVIVSPSAFLFGFAMLAFSPLLRVPFVGGNNPIGYLPGILLVVGIMPALMIWVSARLGGAVAAGLFRTARFC
ncbi:MAG TPA: hypothetical protein PLK80_14725 [bacterium]|nr:hypothetical protein [bacterium]